MNHQENGFDFHFENGQVTVTYNGTLAANKNMDPNTTKDAFESWCAYYSRTPEMSIFAMVQGNK